MILLTWSLNMAMEGAAVRWHQVLGDSRARKNHQRGITASLPAGPHSHILFALEFPDPNLFAHSPRASHLGIGFDLGPVRFHFFCELHIYLVV
jgi:hypothetical protein